MAINYLDEARARREQMLTLRRDLHQHPELAFQEVRTSGIVAERLTELGLEVQTGVGKTGVVGILEGNEDGPTVLVRADMDALPILEENEVDYVSQSDGVMHACGHDAHTTIGLTVAEILGGRRDQIKGRVKFVFQPAEEIGQGAKAMVADGVLGDPVPDVTLGLHVWNTLEVGKIAVVPGPSMASADIFTVTIEGSGGHGAQPQETRDPIVAAAQIVTAVQSIASRNIDPLDTAVISFGSIHGGSAFNVIPSRVEMKGTIRTFRKETKSLVHQRMHEIIEGMAAALGCTASVEINEMTIAVINDDDVSERVAGFAAEVVGAENVLDNERTMGSEDVSYLMDDIPGCYFFVGSGNEERNLTYPHHHPRFDIDEEVMVIGASVLAKAVSSYVLPE